MAGLTTAAVSCRAFRNPLMIPCPMRTVYHLFLNSELLDVIPKHCGESPAAQPNTFCITELRR
jgi:hypothetical protein